jgi:hypothetical protein
MCNDPICLGPRLRARNRAVQPPPKYVSLSAEQAEVFIRELHRSALEPSIATAIAQIIRTYMWLIWSLRETTLRSRLKTPMAMRRGA